MTNKIKAARLAAGMTRVELAHEVDVHSAKILSWERGQAEPSAEMMERLAKVLPSLAPESKLDEIRAQWAELGHNLNDPDRSRRCVIVRTLGGQEAAVESLLVRAPADVAWLVGEVERLTAFLEESQASSGRTLDMLNERIGEVVRLKRELVEQKAFAADCARADKEMGRELIRQRDEAKAERDAATSSSDACRKALAFWGAVLGFEVGRQVNQMVYWTMGDRRAHAPAILGLMAARERLTLGELEGLLGNVARALDGNSEAFTDALRRLYAALGWKP